MKRRIGVCGVIGFAVAAAWVNLSLVLPISREPLLFALARLTCPLLPISLALHFGVKWYWSIASNVAAYTLAGLMFESLTLLLTTRLQLATR